MAKTEIRGAQIKDETIREADIGDEAVRGADDNAGNAREIALGTVSDVDLRDDAVIPAKLDSSKDFQMNLLSLGSSQVTDTILSLTSTTKAFLLSRMTTTQMNAIGTPLNGMMIFDTTTNQFMGYNGTSWIILG